METAIVILAGLLTIITGVAAAVKWGYPKVKGYFDQRRLEREHLIRHVDQLIENMTTVTGLVKGLMHANTETNKTVGVLAKRVDAVGDMDIPYVLAQLTLLNEE